MTGKSEGIPIPEEFKQLTLPQMLVSRPTLRTSGAFYVNMPRLYLADGTWLSVQAGMGLYSTPRKMAKKYTHVEVMSEVELPPAIFGEYGSAAPEVYGYVPLNTLMLYISSRGGIDREKTFADQKEFRT